VTVTLAGLDAWVKNSNDPSKLILGLNGQPMKGVNPDNYSPGSGQLQFTLKRTTDNKDAWNNFLSSLGFYPTAVTVGVFADNATTLFGEKEVRFDVLPPIPWVVGGVLFIIALLVLFLILAVKSNIIRDPGPDLGGTTLRTYSLARAQMAWWTFIILGSYAYIFALTRDINTITQGVLVLMGISAGTGLGSLVVDSGKQDQRKALQTESDSLNKDISNLQNQLATSPADSILLTTIAQKQARIKEIQSTLTNLPAPVGASQNFLLDILEDDGGVNFHRFQLMIWTLALGIIFVYQVWSTLAMPDFNATLLGLMGISSGTYLGFKIPDSPK
jgi:hypothetical protein